MKNQRILHDSTLRRVPLRRATPSEPAGGRVSRAARRLAAPVWLLAAILMILAVVAIAAQPVAGFSIDASLTNGTPSDASDDLLDAARWSDRPGSYVEDRVRGLGGGLEYSVSSDFCGELIPRFVDNPSCEDLRVAIQQTFDLWTEDHPKLRFEDVSSRVATELPPSWVSDPWIGYGAEIDLMALSPDQYSKVKGYGAWTQFWYLFADPMGTNGRVLPGNSLTSADIVINSEACFYLDPAMAADGCNNFSSLLLHETGHVFALGHSNNVDNGYFDSDFDPLNSLVIDCETPHEGLVLSPFANPDSVMNLDQWEQRQSSMVLSSDELGALRFLYPVCSDVGFLSK